MAFPAFAYPAFSGAAAHRATPSSVCTLSYLPRALSACRYPRRAWRCNPAQSSFVSSRDLLPEDATTARCASWHVGRIVTAQLTPSGAPAEALSDCPEPILKAVERLLRQPRITVQDVAASAGVNVSEARDGLVVLANLTGAAIDVTDSGEIAYRFKPNVRQMLRQKSLRASLRMAWRRAFPLLFTAVRVSFGAFLILSIVVTFVAILALSVAASSSSSDERSDRRGSGGGGGGFNLMFGGPRLFGPNIFDVIFYSRRVGDGRGVSRDSQTRGEPSGMSFLESVYSFVFGDGDPNEVVMTVNRWRKMAAVIRANNGAVVAEQLAPFLDLAPNFQPSTSKTVNVVESYMLPVLQRFHGFPDVTPGGDIVYLFPEFGLTGSSRGISASLDLAGAASMSATRETERVLTKASKGQAFMAGALGALNLGAALTLGSMLATAVPSTVDSAAFLSIIRAVYPGILGYALTFVLVPAARLLWLKRLNNGIRARNGSRDRASLALARPSAELRNKLEAASQRAQAARVVSGDSVIYSSDLDAISQPGLQRQATSDFDKRLRDASSDSGTK
jgi:hypothetical protein